MLLEFIIILVLLGGGYYLYENYGGFYGMLNFFTDLFNPAPKPCGGDCYNNTICDLVLKKCRKNCKEGESFYDIGNEGICCNNTTHEIVNDVCTPKCAEGTTRCGSVNCVNPAEEECVDGKICNNQFVANKVTASGQIIKTCCGKDASGNQLFPKDGECVNCQGNKCGLNCCPTKDGPDAKDSYHPENKNPGTKCVQPDWCCNPKSVGKDDVTGKDVCCQNELCGDKCCSGNKTCNKNAPGGPKCQIKCGDDFCPVDTDLCVSNNGKTKCYPASCKWEQTNYIPPAIYDKTGGVQKLRSTCLVANNAITSDKPLVAMNGFPIMKSDTSLSLSTKETNARCKTVDACLGKIQQSGLEDVIFLDTLSIKDNKCEGKVNCSELLPSENELTSEFGYTQDANKQSDGFFAKTLCPAKKEDGTDDVNCCYDKTTKKFNGYVCPDNQLCYNDPLSDKQYCYKKGATQKANYNLNNCSGAVEPTIKKNKITCECPKGTHAGDQCQYNNVQHCNSNGKVEDLDNNYPLKLDAQGLPICKCNPGFVGDKCQDIKILKESDLGLLTYRSSICSNCQIMAGPGVTLTITPQTYTRLYPNTTDLYTNTQGKDVVVDYKGTYMKNGQQFEFNGSVTYTRAFSCGGTYPTVTGTDNFVVSPGSGLPAKSGVAIIGIPVKPAGGTLTNAGALRYLDWDEYDCPSGEIKTSGYWEVGDTYERCCKSNVTSYGNCAYDVKPNKRDGSPYLTESNPALNKSIVQSLYGKGYYYA